MSTISAAQAAARALAAERGGEPVVLVTVVGAPERQAVGRRLVVTAGSLDGSLGDPELDARAVGLGREALAGCERMTRTVAGRGGEWELYVEAHRAASELVIVGAGHIARPLARIGALLGFRVSVIDDRPEFADPRHFPEADRVLVVDYAEAFRDLTIGADSYLVLVTRGHKYDYDCIRQLLELEVRPAYLGMIGSRRRVRATFEALVAGGIEASRLADVRAPIGLDIGAETPEEIALAIAAEIVAVRRGGSGAALSAEERVLERVARRRATERGKD